MKREDKALKLLQKVLDEKEFQLLTSIIETKGKLKEEEKHV
jgi:hypothetical protein